MWMRRGLMGLAGVVAAAGLAAADKPTGLPINPHVENREPNPVAREFHEDAPPAPSAMAAWEQRPRAGGCLVRDLIDEFRELLLCRLTIPLGTVPIEK